MSWISQNPSSEDIKLFIFEEAFNIFASILMVSFFGMDANKCVIEGKNPS